MEPRWMKALRKNNEVESKLAKLSNEDILNVISSVGGLQPSIAKDDRGLEYIHFTEPTTGSSLAIYVKDFSEELLKNRIAEKIEQFKKAKVTCKGCNKIINYINIPEVAMGAIKCPNCNSIIDQEGTVCKKAESNIQIDDIVIFKNENNNESVNGYKVIDVADVGGVAHIQEVGGEKVIEALTEELEVVASLIKKANKGFKPGDAVEGIMFQAGEVISTGTAQELIDKGYDQSGAMKEAIELRGLDKNTSSVAVRIDEEEIAVYIESEVRPLGKDAKQAAIDPNLEAKAKRWQELDAKLNSGVTLTDAEYDELDNVELELENSLKGTVLAEAKKQAEMRISIAEENLHKIIPQKEDDSIVSDGIYEVMYRIRQGNTIEKSLEYLETALEDSIEEVLIANI